MSGTSMAAPLVSGIAALLASKGESGNQIQQDIQEGVDPITGTGVYWKYGRVNAYKALNK
jgi:thermitase